MGNHGAAVFYEAGRLNRYTNLLFQEPGFKTLQRKRTA